MAMKDDTLELVKKISRQIDDAVLDIPPGNRLKALTRSDGDGTVVAVFLASKDFPEIEGHPTWLEGDEYRVI